MDEGVAGAIGRVPGHRGAAQQDQDMRSLWSALIARLTRALGGCIASPSWRDGRPCATKMSSMWPRDLQRVRLMS